MSGRYWARTSDPQLVGRRAPPLDPRRQSTTNARSHADLRAIEAGCGAWLRGGDSRGLARYWPTPSQLKAEARHSRCVTSATQRCARTLGPGRHHRAPAHLPRGLWRRRTRRRLGPRRRPAAPHVAALARGLVSRVAPLPASMREREKSLYWHTSERYLRLRRRRTFGCPECRIETRRGCGTSISRTATHPLRASPFLQEIWHARSSQEGRRGDRVARSGASRPAVLAAGALPARRELGQASAPRCTLTGMETLEDQIVEKAGRILGWFFTCRDPPRLVLKVFLYFFSVGLRFALS